MDIGKRKADNRRAALKKQKYYDPEPFTIVATVASILGGLNGAVSLYKNFAPTRLAASHRQTIDLLERTDKDLTEIEEAVGGMQAAIEFGLDAGTTPFWLGSQIFLPPLYFRQYAKNADRIMGILRRVLRSTHRLERRISVLPYVNKPEMREVVDLQVQIQHILANPSGPAGDLLRDIRAVVRRVRDLIEDVRRDLQGEANRRDI